MAAVLALPPPLESAEAVLHGGLSPQSWLGRIAPRISPSCLGEGGVSPSFRKKQEHTRTVSMARLQTVTKAPILIEGADAAKANGGGPLELEDSDDEMEARGAASCSLM